jgi:hypothetical protein
VTTGERGSNNRNVNIQSQETLTFGNSPAELKDTVTGTSESKVRFEISTAVTMKNVVFWYIKPSSYFTGNTFHLHYRVQSAM